MERRKLTRHCYQKASGTRGQATIEYVLLLVVVVAIIAGLLYQFDSAVQNFAEGYFGGYLACLLETGELPSLGAPSSGTPGEGSCNSQFQSFSLANGRPANGSGAGSSSTSTSSNSSSSSNSNPAVSPNGNGNLTMIPGVGATITFGQSSPLIPAHPPGNQNGKNSSDEDQLDGNDITDLEGGDEGRIIRIPLAESEGFYDGDGGDDAQTKSKIPIPHSAVAKMKNASGSPPLIKAARTVASVQKSTDTGGLSFTKFIRYLFIAIMLIVIVIFIGGQILQVTKSLE